jgi:hypothetical protein
VKKTGSLLAALGLAVLPVWAASAQTGNVRVVDSCLGVDHSPPYAHPSTGAPIDTPSVILWGAALNGAPREAEVAVLMAPPGGGTLDDAARVDRRGRVGGAFGIGSFGDYAGVEITIVFEDPATGEERSITIDPSKLFIGGVFSVGPEEVACDVGSLEEGTLLVAEDPEEEGPEPSPSPLDEAEAPPPDTSTDAADDQALTSDQGGGGGGDGPWVLVTIVGGVLVVIGGGMKVRDVMVKGGPVGAPMFGHPGEDDDYVCPWMEEGPTYPEDPPRPRLTF